MLYQYRTDCRIGIYTEQGIRSIYCENPRQNGYADILMTLDDYWDDPELVTPLLDGGDIQTLGESSAIPMPSSTPARVSKDFQSLLELAVKQGCKMVFLQGEYGWEAYETIPWLAVKWAQSTGILSPENPDDIGPNADNEALFSLAKKMKAAQFWMRNRDSGTLSHSELAEATTAFIQALGDVAIALYVHAQVIGVSPGTLPYSQGIPSPYDANESFEVAELLAQHYVGRTRLFLLWILWDGIAQRAAGKFLEQCAASRLLSLLRAHG